MATTLRIPVIPNQKDGTVMVAKDKSDFDLAADPAPAADEHLGMIPVYNINDGPTGRNGGPYLDQLNPAHMQLVTGPALIIAHSTPSNVHTGPITAEIQGWIADPEYKEEKK